MSTLLGGAARNSVSDWQKHFSKMFAKAAAQTDIVYSANQNISGMIFAKNITVNAGVILTVVGPTVFIVDGYVDLKAGAKIKNPDGNQGSAPTVNTRLIGDQYLSPDRWAQNSGADTPKNAARGSVAYASGSASYGSGGRSTITGGNTDTVKNGWFQYPNVPHWWAFALFRSIAAEYLLPTAGYLPPAGFGLDTPLPICSLNWNGQGISEGATVYQSVPSIEIFCRGQVILESATSEISANGWWAASLDGGVGGLGGGCVGILAFDSIQNSGIISASGGGYQYGGSTFSTCCEGGGGGGGLWLMSPSITQGSLYAHGGIPSWGGSTYKGGDGLIVVDERAILFS